MSVVGPLVDGDDLELEAGADQHLVADVPVRLAATRFVSTRVKKTAVPGGRSPVGTQCS
jgi:hypothetical protein